MATAVEEMCTRGGTEVGSVEGAVAFYFEGGIWR